MTRVTDEPAKRHARDWLERLGLAVEPIPTTDEKRADLRATCENEEYVVEAKSRDTSEWWRALVKQAREEGSATATRSLTPWNAISSMIASAEQQLLATPSGEGAFRILWVVAEHDEDESVIYCVARRLCGTATLLVIGRNLTGYDTRDCYFYAPCDFPRRRAIDAAVLSTRKGIRLFVNSFSPNRSRFRASRLYGELEPHGAVCDPERLASEGRAFIIDEDLGPVGNGHSRWEFLKNRYGVLTTSMIESEFRGVLSIPREELECSE